MNDEWDEETDTIRATVLETDNMRIKSLLHHPPATWSWRSSQASSSETNQALVLAYIQY